MTKPVSPTMQGISGLLRRSGFQQSSSYPSSVRGWRNYTPGFAATKAGIPGYVCVIGYTMHRDENYEAERARLSEYVEVLESNGFIVERGDASVPSSGHYHKLWVRSPIAK